MTPTEYAAEVMESTRREWGWLVSCDILLGSIPTPLLEEVLIERRRGARPEPAQSA